MRQGWKIAAELLLHRCPGDSRCCRHPVVAYKAPDEGGWVENGGIGGLPLRQISRALLSFMAKAVADHQSDIRLAIQHCHRAFDSARQQEIICGEQQEIVACRQPDRFVVRSDMPEVDRVTQHRHPFVFASESGRYKLGFVRRGVVDDKDPAIAMRLGQDAFDALAQEAGIIVASDRYIDPAHSRQTSRRAAATRSCSSSDIWG